MTDISSAVTHHRSRRPGVIDTYPPSLVTGLVAYWKLEEASGTRVDSAGSNNLTATGSVGQAAGKVGNAATFSTGGQNLTNGSSLTPATSSRSVSAWVYPADTSQRTPLSGANTSTNVNPLWLIVTRQGGAAVAVYHGGAYRVGTTNVSANTWYHIVYTFNASTTAVELWVNGTREVNTTAGDVNTATNVYLGQGFSDWTGRIDEVGIWNRALTSSEIAQLYNSGTGVTYPTFA